MPYLVCDKCKGYYKLQEGESPDDFADKCECGGNLKIYDTLNEYVNSKDYLYNYVEEEESSYSVKDSISSTVSDIKNSKSPGFNFFKNSFNKRILGIGVIGIIFIVFGLMFVSADEQYSANGLNFTYSGNMKENVTFAFVTSPQADSKIDTLGNDKLKIAVVYSKAPYTSNQVSVEGYKNFLWAMLNSGSSSKTTSLAVNDLSKNGTIMLEEIYTSKDPVSGNELKNIKLYVFKDLNNFYQVFFQTKSEDFESQQETINKTISSIAIA